MTPPKAPDLLHLSRPTTLLNRLLEQPQRVAAMSSVELHRVVSSLGRTDAVELIALASPEQVRELVDLDVWDRDRVDLPEALDWLHLLLTRLPDDARAADLRMLDVELVGYVLLRHLRIHLLEEGEVPDELEDAILTPDRWFALEILAEDELTGQQVAEVVEQLYQVDHEEIRRLLHNLTAELPSELEEFAHRWRNNRLQDLGFADPQEALLIHAYLDPRAVHLNEGTADRAPRQDLEPVGTALVPLLGGDDKFWDRALSRVDGPVELQRIQQALMNVSNRALSADRLAHDDLDGARVSLQRLLYRLSLGLEFLCDGNLDRAPQALANVALLRIARVGHSLVLDRRRRVLKILRQTPLGRSPGRVDLLDPPLHEQIAGLLASQPWFHDARTASTRPFHDLEDLRLADGWIARLEVVARLVRHSRLPDPLPPDVTLGDLFRTMLLNTVLSRDLTLAVDHPALVRFLREQVAQGQLAPAVHDAAHTLVPDGPAYLELAEHWIRGLEQSVVALDPAEVDLRFVDGLWLQRG